MQTPVSAPVYPRVCGGTDNPLLWRHQITGLSPRVRGNLRARLRSRHTRRSIPACAGEPLPRFRQRGPLSVYPRVCGGTAARDDLRLKARGLSPRVRGNRGGSTGKLPASGSIPACAGEPHRKSGQAPPQTVYPRVCGGIDFHVLGNNVLAGLSPRVRGNQL